MNKELLKINFKFLDIPHVYDITSKANPIPWIQWLPINTELINRHNNILHFCVSNCHYIVYKNHVLESFGFHGFNLFNDLVTHDDNIIQNKINLKISLTDMLK